MLSPATVPTSASAGVELGTAQPQLVLFFMFRSFKKCFKVSVGPKREMFAAYQSCFIALLAEMNPIFMF